MTFEQRCHLFDTLSKRFPCERPYPLVLLHKIPQHLFHDLQQAVALYMLRSLPIKQLPDINEGNLLSAFLANRNLVQNRTPGGLMVPKRTLILEYNAMIKAYVAIIRNLGIGEFISSWAPPSVRYKDGIDAADPVASKRPYATEKIHSDTWEGEFQEGVSTMIPIFGDVERNRVDFFTYPLNAPDSWMDPAPSYDEKQPTVNQCKKLDVPFPKGYLILRDIALLHVTTREPGAQARVSIDTYFSTRMPGPEEKGRIGDFTQEDMYSIGETKLLVTPYAMHERVETHYKQSPVGVHLVDLLPGQEKTQKN